jgi:signal transduction histidine kinase
MAELGNIYLFSVGIAIASVGTLGFVVYFNNPKSATNKTFLVFSLISIVWNICNYLIVEPLPSTWAIWALRGVVFFAVWYCFYIFQLLYVFPKADFVFPKNYKVLLVPVITLISILTLTPLVFEKISSYASSGGIGTVENGPGIFVFGATVFCLIIAALWILIRKSVHASAEEKKPYIFVLIGTFLTFALYIVFNFIFPAFLNQSQFIQLSAVFTFPFVAFTAYAIIKHHLLNVKVFAAQALTFILAVTTFAEVFVAKDIAAILFQAAVFVLVLSFGILLIQSVQREVEQREELGRLNVQIEAQNTQLQDLSRFKSELLSLASHQMKSPLASIKGYGSLIIGGQMGVADDKAKETVGKMVKSADSLVSLINTLLDLRKVEEGKMDYQFAKTDLTKLTQDMFDMLKPLADTKKLEFTFTSPGHEVWVNADAEKLKQVIQNLTDNAIKYTLSGFVKVDLKEDNGAATLSVTDSGVGFSPDLGPHLFEEFVRDERVKKQILGTGLGLYIARKIAEAHGGKISAQSPGEGKGSTFSVTVPEVK